MARGTGVRLGLAHRACSSSGCSRRRCASGGGSTSDARGPHRGAPAAYVGFGALALSRRWRPAAGRTSSRRRAGGPAGARDAFLGGLVLAPLDLVWIAQLLGLAD
jgi:hypothetical protein